MLARIISLLIICVTCTQASAITQKKTVLITGGLSGIGREMALSFKDAGWNVWVTSRNPGSRDELPGVTVRKLDLTNQTEIKNLLKDITTKDGRLDVLINNAAFAVLGPTETVSLAQAREVMDVNVIGPFMLIQQTLPLMRANHGGHIINISSTSGLRALPGLGMYAASKMALEGLSEALAAEAAPWNVKVSIIEPGTVKNDWVNNTSLAEHLDSYPGYKGFTNKLQSKLSNKALDIGQEPSEIAELTLKIANTAHPDLRYQTNNAVTELATQILVDPSGNNMRDQTVAIGRELYESPF